MCFFSTKPSYFQFDPQVRRSCGIDYARILNLLFDVSLQLFLISTVIEYAYASGFYPYNSRQPVLLVVSQQQIEEPILYAAVIVQSSLKHVESPVKMSSIRCSILLALCLPQHRSCSEGIVR